MRCCLARRAASRRASAASISSRAHSCEEKNGDGAEKKTRKKNVRLSGTEGLGLGLGEIGTLVFRDSRFLRGQNSLSGTARSYWWRKSAFLLVEKNVEL